ncbi:MAG TPA: serine hydrolase domain-containing protein [Planctomycetota bacterium]|nr:serine hydrolase domain-containing protein [Planctomycetota bacterium]
MPCRTLFLLSLATVIVLADLAAAEPQIPQVTSAMQEFVDKKEIAGAVTIVVTPENVAHLSAVGQADIAANKPMTPDTIFWIASMTKPVTGVAIMMLQDEGKLSYEDPVEKYIPEFATLKTADGKAYKLTLKHLLTHTSGLAEATGPESEAARTLADLIPHYVKRPLQFEPGSKWQYCQSGINTLGRIVEVVSGQTLPEFFQKRLFEPLGMKDTTFYPNAEQQTRITKAYKVADGKLTEAALAKIFDPKRPDHFPAANGGLFSTAADYGRFCQMLLNDGSLGGKQFLKPYTVKLMASVHSGELKTGFTEGNAWGLGCCVVRQPQGVSAALSAGSYGHGGAFGTQAWIDPVKKIAYVLMVQRSNFPNSDNSDVRKNFQAAAAAALAQ